MGGSRSFDGTMNYVQISDDASLDFGTGDFTICAWFKDSGGVTREFIVSKDDNTGDGLWYIELGNGAVDVALDRKLGVFIFQDGSNSNYERMSSVTDALDDSVWHHVAAVMDKSSGSSAIYVDGVLQTTETSISNGTYADIDVDSNDNVRIGDDNRIGSSNFGGSICGVRTYDRVLSDSEILELASGKMNTITKGLKLWMPLQDAGVSPTYTDISGEGNNSSSVDDPTESTDAPQLMWT